MKILITAGAAALLASAAVAQQQQPAEAPAEQQTHQQQQAQTFVEAGPEDVFVTRLIGTAVFAPEDVGQAQSLDNVTGHTIDSAALADFVNVGMVADVMMTRDGQPRAVVIALTDPAEPGVGAAGTADGMPPPGVMAEIAVDAGQVRYFADEAVPNLTFAVVGVAAQDLMAAPTVERPMLADPVPGEPGAVPPQGPATMPGWTMGRAPMAAPGVTIDGYTQVPVAEISVDDLTGATVYGADQANIGSINDVIVDTDGRVQYVTVDVGGFLGIGTREVAIGFDEMTVLRDAGWEDLQVHIAATEAELEAMPEHQQN